MARTPARSSAGPLRFLNGGRAAPRTHDTLPALRPRRQEPLGVPWHSG